MSRDIRSFFISKKPQTPKVEDDDVIPESPEVQIKKKKKESRKKRVLEDSDEEIFTTKQKKSKEDTKKLSHSKNKSPKKGLKEVSAVDLFGNGPINRTEPMVKKVKKKTETGIHSDDEFDQSLLELDEVDEIKQVKGEKTISPVKRKDTIKSPTKNISVSNSKGSNSLEISANGAGSLKDKKQDEKQNEITAKENVFKSNGSDVKTNQVDKSPHKDSKKLKVHEKAMKIDEGAQKGTDLKTQHNAKLNKLNETAKTEKKVESNNSKCSRTQNSKFSEFIDDDNKTEDSDKNVKSNKRKFNNSLNESQLSDSQDDRGRKSKKKKLDATLNDSVLTDEERYERKRHSAALYQKYLNRSGPKHLGSKEIPEGSPNCLSNCAFLLTGVLDSFEREEVVAAITKYGGCVKSSMSKKVTHVLAGEDAGPAKIAKAEEFGIRILNEDEFLQMITDSKSSNKTGKDKKDTKRERSPNQKTPKKSSKVTKSSNSLEIKKETNHVKTETKSNHKSINIEIEKVDNSKNKINIPTVKSEKSIKQEVEVNQEQPKSEINGTNSAVNNLQAIMWVDKYKPQNLKQIIGQHGDASNVKKLSNWLTKWYVNRKAKVPKPSPWAKNDDGAYFKAALLSGPPGVGKTTTVSLVCKELGFDVVEFNASDTRSKSLIKEQVGELLTTTSLSGYAAGKTGKQAVTKKHVLVMDEVDGMAGNEDRGGLQELIGLIKVTSVPIICMCNDRNSQKMRSLVNYCYDLRFSRPRVDQIKSAMLSICFKEGLKIPPDVLGQLIVSANQDVRQTLNLLSMWAVDASLADAARLRKDAGGCKKDVKLGPWEAVRKVFSSEEHKTMSIHDKSDLFFYDYSLAPLFVQENYLQVAPHCPKSEVLSRLSAAADSLSVGDLVDARVRRCQAWGLLPVQAMYSSVIPGHHMSGHVTGQINFPGWLGKNSRAGKMQRLCQEIHAHTRLSTSGSKSSIFLDYSTHIRDAIINPLVRDKADGIPQALEVLEAYHLLREDLDSLVELSLWPGQRNPTVLIDSQVKAAMTRTYNKKASALPYAQTTIKRGKAQPDDELMDSEEIEGEEEVDDSDPEHDALIKKKSKEKISKNKETSSSKAGSSKQKASSSKKKK